METILSAGVLVALVVGFLAGHWHQRYMLKKNPEKLASIVNQIKGVGAELDALRDKAREFADKARGRFEKL